MNKEIILKLSEHLATVDQFNMRSWLTIDANLLKTAVENDKISVVRVNQNNSVIGDSDYITFSELEDYCEESHILESYDDCDAYGLTSFDIYQDLNSTNKNECLTTACVGGWAVLMKNNFKFDSDISSHNQSDISEEAAEYLELTDSQAHNLFFCHRGSIWDLVAEEYEKTSYRTFLEKELAKTFDGLTELRKEELQLQIETILSSPQRIRESKSFYNHEYHNFLYESVDAKIASDVLRRLATTDDFILGSDEDEAGFPNACFSESYINNKNKEKQNA
jgi:hypothetical protein